MRVVFGATDNGGWLGYGGLNFPYRGDKTTLYALYPTLSVLAPIGIDLMSHCLHRWEGGLRGLSWIVAPGLIAPGTVYQNLFHVTDWLPTLAAAAGIDLTSSAGAGFDAIDGVSHWLALTSTAVSRPTNVRKGSVSVPPRTEILFNIDGVNGTGAAAIRVGQYKLLRSSQHSVHGQQRTAAISVDVTAEEVSFRSDGPPAAVPSLGMDWWCDICTTKGGCSDAVKPAKAAGGVYCSNATLNATAAAAAPHYAPTECGEGYMCYIFDVLNDPTESNNLASTRSDLLVALMGALGKYQKGNVPCCSCSLLPDAAEMSLPPKDGTWYTFHDESDPTVEANPLCDLLREPARNK
eukprot:COSAG02_NODE_820_length_16798_cov_10.212887_7_plen_350_part_00